MSASASSIANELTRKLQKKIDVRIAAKLFHYRTGLYLKNDYFLAEVVIKLKSEGI